MRTGDIPRSGGGPIKLLCTQFVPVGSSQREPVLDAETCRLEWPARHFQCHCEDSPTQRRRPGAPSPGSRPQPPTSPHRPPITARLDRARANIRPLIRPIRKDIPSDEFPHANKARARRMFKGMAIKWVVNSGRFLGRVSPIRWRLPAGIPAHPTGSVESAAIWAIGIFWRAAFVGRSPTPRVSCVLSENSGPATLLRQPSRPQPAS